MAKSAQTIRREIEPRQQAFGPQGMAEKNGNEKPRAAKVRHLETVKSSGRCW